MATNIKADLKGSVLTLTIDLSKDHGKSKSNKSDIIAKTGGNVGLGDLGVKNVPEDYVDVRVGLNCYK